MKQSHNTWIDRLDVVLTAFEGRKIIVVGDLMLDEYILGQSSRVSPEAPVLVLDIQRNTYCLGGAANVARNVSRMGAEVTTVGVVGHDSAADKLRSCLRENGCSSEGVIALSNRPTTVKTRVVAQNHQIVRMDRETRVPVDEDDSNKLLEIIDALIPDADGMILSDYAKGVLTDSLVTDIIARAKHYGVPLAANLKPPRVDPFRGASLLTLNLVEAELAWSRSIREENDLCRCGRELRERLECKGLLITRGGNGVALFSENDEPLIIPSHRVQVFDVTGAGDTVISAAALAIFERRILRRCRHDRKSSRKHQSYQNRCRQC